ncbi:MAG: hypothetical protein E7294_11760 [Lachnospiraceae bacterium]|nr:hypothetical protein [Lachnospiraceae bacterium]
MGLFDNLLGAAKEIADGTKKAVENIQREMDQEVNNKKSVDYEGYKNPSDPLPAVPVQTKLHGNIARFMISGDFTENEGYANSAVSLRYNPEHLGVLELDDENAITISLQEGIGEFDEIAECIDEYISSGTLSDVIQFENISDGKYLFKAKMSASEYIENFYVLKSDVDDSYDYDILLLLFPFEVEGTVLEKKLSTCFDEVAKTLTI